MILLDDSSEHMLSKMKIIYSSENGYEIVDDDFIEYMKQITWIDVGHVYLITYVDCGRCGIAITSKYIDWDDCETIDLNFRFYPAEFSAEERTLFDIQENET